MFKKFWWMFTLPFVYLILVLKMLSAKRKCKKYKKNPDDFLDSERYDIVYSIAKWYLYTKNIRYSLFEKIDTKIISRSQLVIANHRSNMDPILIFVLLCSKTPIKPVFIAKQELKDTYFSFLYDLIDTIYIDRTNLRQMVSTINNQVEILKSNKILVVFPEGTRNDSNELLEFKSGALECAYKTMSPIQPIVIRNQEFYMEKSKENKKDRKPITIQLLPPYQPSSFVQIDRNIFSKNIREQMQEVYKKLDN